MSITSSNAIIILMIPNVFPSPQQIQNFAADDITDWAELDTVETRRGADGRLTGGVIFGDLSQTITLQGDSDSNEVFDSWYRAQKQTGDVYPANGTITYTAIGKEYTMTRGFLTQYKPSPDAKRVLEPRKYTIKWESIIVSRTGAPV